MSAVAKDYVYEVKACDKTRANPVPVVGKDKLAEYKANVAKYLDKPDVRKD